MYCFFLQIEIGTHVIAALSDVNVLLEVIGFCKSLSGEFCFR